MTFVAAFAVSGCKKLLKVSGKRTTGGPSGFTAPRSLNQSLKVSVAKGGIWRSVVMPPAFWTNSLRTGVWVTRFASRGTNWARRAWNMMRPIVYAYAGPGQRSRALQLSFVVAAKVDDVRQAKA